MKGLQIILCIQPNMYNVYSLLLPPVPAAYPIPPIIGSGYRVFPKNGVHRTTVSREACISYTSTLRHIVLNK